MLIVDAGCLYETLVDGPLARAVWRRLDLDDDLGAPHIVDVEVFGVIRRERLRAKLDHSAATQAVNELATWAGERYPHTPLLPRAWELRDTVRGWDAMYVALAELLDVPLITTDRRLAKAKGPRCAIEVVGV